MSEATSQLGATLKKQNEIISELLDIVILQRDALKAGRHADLQAQMSQLRQASVRCQAIEAKRVRCAEEAAKELDCGLTVSEIVASLPEGDESRAEIDEEGRKLMQTVERLKVEMTIIGKLMEEAKSLNEMLISEWQKLSMKSLGVGKIGTFDAKI